MTASWHIIIVKLIAVVIVIFIVYFYLMLSLTIVTTYIIEYTFSKNTTCISDIVTKQLSQDIKSIPSEKIEEKSIVYTYDQYEVEMLCKLVYGEARGIVSTMEKSAVVWCVLNRVDSARFPNTITDVVTAPGQFTGYKAHHPVLSDIKYIVVDVLTRYYSEKMGVIDSGRVLPKEYLFFYGNGRHNVFRTSCGIVYDWHLANPYINNKGLSENATPTEFSTSS